jgi:HEAT repeat protein
MSTRDDIDILLGLKKIERRPGEDCVPSYLAGKYDKEGAALSLARTTDMREEVLGALLRAALMDDEEDVRRRSVEALVQLDESLATITLIACTYDSDDSVRESSLDLLNSINSDVANGVAQRMLHDPDEFVVEEAKRILALNHVDFEE